MKIVMDDFQDYDDYSEAECRFRRSGRQASGRAGESNILSYLWDWGRPPKAATGRAPERGGARRGAARPSVSRRRGADQAGPAPARPTAGNGAEILSRTWLVATRSDGSQLSAMRSGAARRGAARRGRGSDARSGRSQLGCSRFPTPGALRSSSFCARAACAKGRGARFAALHPARRVPLVRRPPPTCARPVFLLVRSPPRPLRYKYSASGGLGGGGGGGTRCGAGLAGGAGEEAGEFLLLSIMLFVTDVGGSADETCIVCGGVGGATFVFRRMPPGTALSHATPCPKAPRLSRAPTRAVPSETVGPSACSRRSSAAPRRAAPRRALFCGRWARRTLASIVLPCAARKHRFVLAALALRPETPVADKNERDVARRREGGGGGGGVAHALRFLAWGSKPSRGRAPLRLPRGSAHPRLPIGIAPPRARLPLRGWVGAWGRMGMARSRDAPAQKALRVRRARHAVAPAAAWGGPAFPVSLSRCVFFYYYVFLPLFNFLSFYFVYMPRSAEVHPPWRKVMRLRPSECLVGCATPPAPPPLPRGATCSRHPAAPDLRRARASSRAPPPAPPTPMSCASGPVRRAQRRAAPSRLRNVPRREGKRKRAPPPRLATPRHASQDAKGPPSSLCALETQVLAGKGGGPYPLTQVEWRPQLRSWRLTAVAAISTDQERVQPKRPASRPGGQDAALGISRKPAEECEFPRGAPEPLLNYLWLRRAPRFASPLESASRRLSSHEWVAS
ncbi:Protein of unknown function [Gryllus bimaculatus]|nr:Protein of unknown function [Gryllus bimaculatus]